jgi:hypothetical protein
MKNKQIFSLIVRVFVLAMLLAACVPAQPTHTVESSSAPQPTPTVVSGAGDITAVVDQYRSLLGPDNGVEPGNKGWRPG